MHPFVQIPNWIGALRFSSSQLMVLAGVLLFLAGVLLGLRKSRSVRLERSYLTDELVIYLSRIADALERNTPPTSEQIIQQIQRRIGGRNDQKDNAKIHSIPFSTFGREYSDEK